jgi:hypothetical protein
MNRYLLALLVGIAVAAAALVIFRLLLPWFTYSRAFLLVTAMIFTGGAITLCLAWTARGGDSTTTSARSRYLFWQGVGLFAIGVVWLLASRWLLHR